MECDDCKSIFKTSASLNYHKQNAKYCLEGRNESNTNFQCEFCLKNLSTKHCLDLHKNKCKSNIESIRKQNIVLVDENKQLNTMNNLLETKIREQKSSYEKQIKELQDKLENIAVERNFEDENDLDIDEFVSDKESDADEYKLQPLEVGNGFTIEHREEDGFINVTNLFKVAKKQFSDWNKLDETDHFIEVLSSSIGLPSNELIKYKTCSINEREIWTHPHIAINIAQWISPNFKIKVSSWVYEAMMTGKVYITNTKSYKELQKENKNKDLKIQFLTKKYVKLQPRV
jgi:hypothetical protein